MAVVSAVLFTRLSLAAVSGSLARRVSLGGSVAVSGFLFLLLFCHVSFYFVFVFVFWGGRFSLAWCYLFGGGLVLFGSFVGCLPCGVHFLCRWCLCFGALQ